MINRLSLAFSAAVLSGCAALGMKPGTGAITGPSDPTLAVQIAPTVSTTALGAQGVSAAALDRTTAAEKASALAAPVAGGERQLGRVVVALGPPGEQGIWLSSALVTAVANGRVVTAAGQSIGVELRPGSGGALLSLAAFQALGLTLTDLPEVTVFGP